MNILINCSNIKVGGGLQVAQSFLQAISTFEENFNYIIVASSELSALLNIESFPSNFTFITYNIRSKFIGSIIGVNKKMSNIEKEFAVDVVFTLFGPSYWRPASKHVVGFAKAQYIYKDSPYFNELTFVEKTRLLLKEMIHIRDFRRNSDVLVSENPDVSNRLSKRLAKKVYTVSNTYNQIFNDPLQWKRSICLPNDSKVYLLCIAANYSHKNLGIIPLVIDQMIKTNITKYKFVLTISQNELKGFHSRHSEYIVFLGKVDVNECPFLYEQCKYVFMPTLLECFTATYPEAMKMQKPILTSDLFFAKAICGEYAIYFNPLDPIDILNKITEIDTNPDKYQSIIKGGIQNLLKMETGDSRAEKYIQILKNVH